jgi:DNA polymerase III delta subunit
LVQTILFKANYESKPVEFNDRLCFEINNDKFNSMRVVYKQGDEIVMPLKKIKNETLKERIERRADKLNYKHSQHAIKTFKPVIKG